MKEATKIYIGIQNKVKYLIDSSFNGSGDYDENFKIIKFNLDFNLPLRM